MLEKIALVKIAFLLPFACLVSYNDVRFRRIPNIFVLIILIGGLVINTAFGGLNGALSSLGGCIVAFSVLFILYVYGGMGAGDVKLFAACGAVIGFQNILHSFVVIATLGGIIAIVSMIRAGIVRSAMRNVVMILVGFLPGWKIPHIEVPPDRSHTVPYGVAITLGSLISLYLFR
jgi:prepilin peptidase CpaA